MRLLEQEGEVIVLHDYIRGIFWMPEIEMWSTPAPEPDYHEDGVPYWNSKGFMAYIEGYHRWMTRYFEDSLAKHELNSLVPYPPIPVLPMETKTANGVWMWSEAAMVNFCLLCWDRIYKHVCQSLGVKHETV